MKRTPSILFLLVIMTLTLTTTVYAAAGKHLNINVFVNNVKVNTPVYENTSAPPVQGDDFYPVYVDLVKVFERLDAEIKFAKPHTVYITGKKTGNVKIVVGKSVYCYKSPSFKGKYIDYSSIADQTILIKKRIFISLSNIRYIIGGSLKQEKNAVYLYSSDFERLDIPGTLEETFIKLDKLLDKNSKDELKVTPEQDLSKYHFSLGMWIRNNWILPSQTRIAKLFLDKGISHPDDMSAIIITSYHRYLCHKEINLAEQIKKYEQITQK